MLKNLTDGTGQPVSSNHHLSARQKGVLEGRCSLKRSPEVCKVAPVMKDHHLGESGHLIDGLSWQVISPQGGRSKQVSAVYGS